MGYVWSQQWPQEEEAVTRIACRYCAHSEGRLWSSGGENRKTGTFISRSAVRGTLESNNTIWTICREPRKNQDSNQDSHSPRAPRPGSSMPRTQAEIHESNMILTEIQRITYYLRSNSFLSPHCCSGGSVPCQCERLDAELAESSSPPRGWIEKSQRCNSLFFPSVTFWTTLSFIKYAVIVLF